MISKFTTFPTLETERLVLRQILLTDDKEIFYERSNAAINKYVDRPPCHSIDEARNWINMITDNAVNGLGVTWGLTLKDSDKLMGGFCFWNLSEERNSGEIGFSLHPEYWGKGLMQEALTECIRFGFDVMELQTIEAFTQPENISSVKLLEKNGFIRSTQRETPGDPYAAYILERAS